jgi:hypothetical protein
MFGRVDSGQVMLIRYLNSFSKIYLNGEGNEMSFVWL